ncbi:MAG TPA: VOC family protein [Acidocella sp.]|uniref:VOC family protein n=1 Tax=Acidocella sp. TaxID=50710 RepID=UPI002CF11B80|nr:VOC family protein [Acidocella sp.]HVE21315.1 VOC family protein [Acidocella sp.]
MSESHGKFVWYELLTTDPAKAATFYSAVIGWEAKDASIPGVPYTLLSINGESAAGLMEMPETLRATGAKPLWLGYVGVDDVDKIAALATAKGAVVHKGPADIPNVGRFAVLTDPQGALFALFKSHGGESASLPQLRNPGHGGWHELIAANAQDAFAFYSSLFGWTKAEAIDMGPMGSYQLFAHNGVPIGGMMTCPQAQAPTGWTYYFNVRDIKDTLTRINASGGTVQMGPQEVPGGSWIIQGLDPQGGRFAVVAPPKE